jgi:hypothetical protein
MKHYTDFTAQELDELYAGLSEASQDFVYGDIIKNEVADIAKQVGLHIDKWSVLNVIVLETILGIIPSSLFRSEVLNQLDVTPEIADNIVAHFENQIFSVIRDESISEYEDQDTKNQNISDVGAIYDEAIDNIENDPYRESIGDMRSGPLITEDKLHLVDELFAPHHPKVKELTPADGSVRVQPADSLHIPHLFGEQKVAKEPSSMIITKSSLLASEGVSTPTENKANTPAEPVRIPVISQSEVAPRTETKKLEVKSESTSQKAPELEPRVSGKLEIHIEKSAVPGKIQITVRKPKILKETSGIEAEKTVIPAQTQPTTYTVDPYKEII